MRTPIADVMFRGITADPAWKCKDQCPGPKRGASKHYKTMTTPQICDLAKTVERYRGDPKSKQLYLQMSGRRCAVADDALLFLWRLSSMQRDALDVARAWGFVDKAELVWVKYRPCVDCQGAGRGVHLIKGDAVEWICELCEGTGCGTPWMGMGHYTRGQHETCLIAARGRAASLVENHGIRSVLHAPVPWNWDTNRAVHSAKPERFYTEIVEKMVKGPYLELFSRKRRQGWTVLGNQVGKMQRFA